MKAVIDATARPLKDANVQMRKHLTKYMIDNDLLKIEGKEIKSITLQKKKTTTEAVGYRQIMVGRTYKDLNELSKDDLIKMLEEKGVKTRLDARNETTTKDASVRVQK